MRILSLMPIIVSAVVPLWLAIVSSRTNASASPETQATSSKLKVSTQASDQPEPQPAIAPPKTFEPGTFIKRANADLEKIATPNPPFQPASSNYKPLPPTSPQWDRLVARSLTGQSTSAPVPASSGVDWKLDNPVMSSVSEPETVRSDLFVSQAVTPASLVSVTNANVASVNDVYVLGAGDRIQINIFNVPEYSGEHQVLADGSLNLPVVGKVNVIGLTLEQAGGAIAASYSSELQYARVTVSLLRPRPLQVTIVGEVNRPGLYTLTLTEEANFPGVVQAVQAAGGATQAADLRLIEIRRPQSNGSYQTITVNLQELLSNGDQNQNLSLRDGDTIKIAETSEINLTESAQLAASNLSGEVPAVLDVAIVGEVSRPGAYKISSNTEQTSSNRPTLTQAIQTAGGVTPVADLRKIQVLRSTRSGTDQIININLMQLIETGDLSQDLILQQGDRVVIAKAEALTPEEITRVTSANVSPGEIQVNVVGQVVNPGAVKVKANTTLNQAVLAAGGFNQRARRRVQLIRINPNGTLTRRTIEVDLDQGVDSESNPILWNNDIIIAGRSSGAQFTDSLRSILEPIFQILPFF